MKIIAFNIANAHPWKYSRPGWKAEPDVVNGNPFQSRGAGTRPFLQYQNFVLKSLSASSVPLGMSVLFWVVESSRLENTFKIIKFSYQTDISSPITKLYSLLPSPHISYIPPGIGIPPILWAAHYSTRQPQDQGRARRQSSLLKHFQFLLAWQGASQHGSNARIQSSVLTLNLVCSKWRRKPLHIVTILRKLWVMIQ